MFYTETKYKTKIQMARQLTKEAKVHVLNDPKLYAEICIIINVTPSSLSQLIYKNRPSVLNHDVVTKIAASMKKTPDQILQAESKKTSKKTQVQAA